jgi:hypothetical protein
MDFEMAAGFAAVIACLLAIAILVFAGRNIVEKTHLKTPRNQSADDRGGDKTSERSQAR